MHTTKTTIHLTLPRTPRWLASIPPALIVAVLLIALAAGIALIGRLWGPKQPTTQAAQPTSALVMVISTPVPTARPLPTATPRMVIAWTAPNGDAFPDPIPMPDPSTWIARWGDDWIAVAWQPYAVWIRASDLGASLADVRPVPELPPTQAPAPALADQPTYHTTSAREAPAQADPGRTAEQQRAYDAWIAQGQAILDAHAAHPEDYGQQPLTLDDMPCNCP